MTAPTPAERLAAPAGQRTVFLLLIALAAGAAALVFTTHRLAFLLDYATALGPPILAPAFAPAIYGAGSLLAVLLGWLFRRQPPLLGLLLVVALVFLLLAFGPVYPPLGVLEWVGPLLSVPSLRATVAEVARESLLVGGLSALLLAYLFRGYLRVGEASNIAHGSARLARGADLKAAGLLDGAGTRLGAVRRGGRLHPLADDSDQHVLLVMPSGAGKTSGPILSTILATADSAVVLDPKREIWRLSAGWRVSQGHRVICWSPTAAVGTPAWNCLDEISRGSGELAEIRTVASNLVSYSAEEKVADHWVNTARSLFTLLALHLLYVHPQPSISAVRALLNAGSLDELFSGLAGDVHDPDGRWGWTHPVTGEPTRTHPEVYLLASAFSEIPPRERGSIVSTLQTFLALWGDEVIRRNTETSDFSVADLLGEQPVTLYVGLPYGDLRPLGPLLRIFLAILMRRLTSDEEFDDAGSRPERRRVQLFLDELVSLGRLPILEDMLAFLRGYGVRAHLAIQDLSQLHRIYSAQESLTGNCQIHVAAATLSASSRMHVSKLAGEATVRFRRRSLSGNRLAARGSRRSVSDSDARRPLLTEGEVATLPPDRLLVVKTGLPPIMALKYPWFKDPLLRARAALEAPPLTGPAAPPPASVAALPRPAGVAALESRREPQRGVELER